MKTRTLSSFLLFSMLCLFVFSGCKKKEEDNPNNGGSSSGFTNADYAGTWNVSLQCNTTESFQMTIAATGSNGVTITSFHKRSYPNGFTVTGTVSGGSLTIPSQQSTSSSQGTFTFAGTGTLSSATALSIPYSIGTGASVINCTATCTK